MNDSNSTPIDPRIQPNADPDHRSFQPDWVAPEMAAKTATILSSLYLRLALDVHGDPKQFVRLANAAEDVRQQAEAMTGYDMQPAAALFGSILADSQGKSALSADYQKLYDLYKDGHYDY